MGLKPSFSIIGVVGQMRSGTSAVAQTVHLLGIPMGIAFLAPIRPTYRFEWEDSYLSMTFAKMWMSGIEPDVGWKRWWEKYSSDRKLHADRVWRSKRWGFKTPPWVLQADTLLPLTQEVGYTALIHVDRPQGSIDASVRATFPPSLQDRAMATNATISSGLRDLPCHLRVPYDEMVDDPKTWVNKIAGLLEVDDQDRIADATGRMERPTSWPQSSPPSSEEQPSPA